MPRQHPDGERGAKRERSEAGCCTVGGFRLGETSKPQLVQLADWNAHRLFERPGSIMSDAIIAGTRGGIPLEEPRG
jgi:hypothetical protein